ncbi:hypothetical protein G6L28_14750 [Agrobacterium larrymoorei]|uniref:hypothetical protein n=1 Tax=Agrobacterium larrymoorei TaxID=160699 RepID=UPI00157253E7|nr:hypothetical protein [Agrobacterium larrymoorei]NTJ43859.1 hypothetical protein [Agrobacterium larrymoorei]
MPTSLWMIAGFAWAESEEAVGGGLGTHPGRARSAEETHHHNSPKLAVFGRM